VHFEDSCFELRAAVLSPESEIKFKRFLVKGAIPTRDTVVPYSSPESKRKRRRKLEIYFYPTLHLGKKKVISKQTYLNQNE